MASVPPAPPAAPHAGSPAPDAPGVGALEAIEPVDGYEPVDEPDDTGPTDDETIELTVVEPGPHPLIDLTEDELEKMLQHDPESLGSISVGTSSAGRLFNPVPMPEGEHWFIKDPDGTYGTQETVDALARVITHVAEKFPDSPQLYIGHISSPTGGYLKPHGSHQAGRDADIGYYYTTPRKSASELASEKNLDLDRTWELIRALVTQADIQWIFSDSSVIKLIKEHALSLGEDPEWIDSIFGGPLSKERALVIHVGGHATHLHVRFYNPIAQETGRRMYKVLLANKKIHEIHEFTKYKVKRGDTLSKIARKHKTSVKAIKKANGLKNDRIYAGRTYKIPKRKAGGVKNNEALKIPPRRLPPS